ncbi:MAG: hypothetical protein P8P99_07270 [Maricaulis sp.]|nr:hypothetical protein [Maricaulis sp.]
MIKSTASGTTVHFPFGGRVHFVGFIYETDENLKKGTSINRTATSIAVILIWSVTVLYLNDFIDGINGWGAFAIVSGIAILYFVVVSILCPFKEIYSKDRHGALESG